MIGHRTSTPTMPVEFKDYYRVLGVPSQATDAEIKKAFRMLARQYHPDVAKDKMTAEERFMEVNEAHEVLSDPESRRKYDQLGAEWKTGARSRPLPGPGQSRSAGRETSGEPYEFQFEGTGFSDFFERFFGGSSNRSRGKSPFSQHRTAAGTSEPEAARRGQDIQGDILITLHEVVHGAMRAISVRRPNALMGQEETETHQVRIPAGVQSGQLILVPGKGGEGLGGGSAGDIYLRVRYAQHPDCQVRGVDLVGHLELAPWEAVLGATVPVRTLEGIVSLKVPSGTQQGHQLRLRGKGLPDGSGQRGDFLAGVSIQVPSRLSKEDERLWKQLAKQSHFDPRQTS